MTELRRWKWKGRGRLGRSSELFSISMLTKICVPQTQIQAVWRCGCIRLQTFQEDMSGFGTEQRYKSSCQASEVLLSAGLPTAVLQQVCSTCMHTQFLRKIVLSLLWVVSALQGQNVCLSLNPSCSDSEKAGGRETKGSWPSQTSVAALKTWLD